MIYTVLTKSLLSLKPSGKELGQNPSEKVLVRPRDIVAIPRLTFTYHLYIYHL